MSVDDAKANSDITAIADGMIALLKKNLVSHTILIQDAHIGDTIIYVDDNLRFDRNNNIVLMDNNSVYNPDAGEITGLEFHVIKDYITETNKIVLKEALQQDFLIANNGRIQKAIKNTILFAKDILYGDREVIPFDYVAITVDSEHFTSQWLALRMMSDEFRLGINVYVKSGGTPEQEELNIRIRDAYANAIYNLLMENIHLDVALDETPIKRDVAAGSNYVYIDSQYAADWPTDPCYRYSVQDNFGTNQDLNIIDCEQSSNSSNLSSLSSELSSSTITPDVSTTSSSLSSSRSSGSSSTISESFTSLSSGSSSSLLMDSTSSSDLSSASSSDDDLYMVCFNGNLTRNYLLKDKTVLRRINRYLYNTQVSDIEYGVTQKGSTILKAAKISWWGKESRDYSFPQVGKGGNIGE
jgi:hypothetical protein